MEEYLKKGIIDCFCAFIITPKAKRLTEFEKKTNCCSFIIKIESPSYSKDDLKA